MSLPTRSLLVLLVALIPFPNIIKATDGFPGRQNWMASLPNDIYLSQLTLPGTHESCARYNNRPFSSTSICQTMTIAQQLNAGIRMLDIRCRLFENNFPIHHGVDFQNLYFNDVQDECIRFLKQNPTECIVMLLNKEWNDAGSTKTFEEVFHRYTEYTKGHWYLADRIPTLGEARGKIVLLRRFEAQNLPLGISVGKDWLDDKNSDFHLTNGRMKIQDQYSVANRDNKWNNIVDFFNLALLDRNPQTWYLNYTTGAKLGIHNPKQVADVINPRLSQYLSKHQVIPPRLGTIMMDFVEQKSIDLIIQNCLDLKNGNTSPVFTVSKGRYGGNPFEDTRETVMSGPITRIAVRSGREIDQIQIQYGNKTGGAYGGNGGDAKSWEVPQGYKIVRLKGRAGQRIDGLQFTAKNASGQTIESPWFGGGGGDPFDLYYNETPLRMIRGRSGTGVDNLEFVFTSF